MGKMQENENPYVEVRQNLHGQYLVNVEIGAEKREYLYYTPMELVLGLAHHFKYKDSNYYSLEKETSSVAKTYEFMLDTVDFLKEASDHFRRVSSELDEENTGLRNELRTLKKEITKLEAKLLKAENELTRAEKALGKKTSKVVKPNKEKKNEEETD